MKLDVKEFLWLNNYDGSYVIKHKTFVIINTVQIHRIMYLKYTTLMFYYNGVTNGDKKFCLYIYIKEKSLWYLFLQKLFFLLKLSREKYKLLQKDIQTFVCNTWLVLLLRLMKNTLTFRFLYFWVGKYSSIQRIGISKNEL